MLSVENSPDPSCSCNLLGIKADERASDKSSLPEADQQKPGDFSIRKYVFTSRSKDIGTSWPFSLRFLQLCQKHGIKDPLPPFEPPDTVRAQSLEKGVECDQRVTLEEGERETLTDVELPVKKNASFLALEDNNIKEKSAHPSDPLVLKSLGQAQFPLNLSNTKPAQGEEDLCKLSKLVCCKEATGEGDITSTVTDHDVHIDANSSLTVRPPCLVAETNKSQYSCEPPESKRRLIIKLCGSTESSRTEEILTNTSSAVDPMSSKICPVCRIFSSSSNTTLNAHIDQCLADESTANGIVNKLSKPHKVKPRKMRSMVDICATAPQCTLEELERRNGIIRPVDCGSFAPNEKILAQSKGPRLGPTDFCDDPSDNAVYVDSSGTKIRILSRFSDTLDPVARENVKSRKLMKDKSLPSSKKRHLGLINSESLKGKSQNKKFCSIKQFKSQIFEAPDRKHQVENQEKEESLFQFRKPEDAIKAGGPPGTLRHWVCSKRTGLSGKPNDKTSLTRNPLVRSTSLIVDRSSAERSPTVKLSKWPKKCISFPRSKRGHNLLDPNSSKDRERDHLDPPDRNGDLSTKGHLPADCSSPKLAKTPGNHVSSPRSKRVEIDACTESHPIPFSPKSKKKSRFRSVLFEKPSPPTEAKNHMEREVRPAFKKPRKDRCMGQIGNRVEELPSNEIQGYVSLSVDRLCRTRKLRRSNIISRSETVEDMKEASKEEKQAESTSERSLSNTHGPDLEKVDSQVGGSLEGPITYCFPFGTGLESATKEVTASGDVFNAFLAKKTAGNHIGEMPMSEANLSANCSDLQSDSSPSLEEHILPLSESEMWVEHAESRSGYDQEKHIAEDSTGISSRTAEFDSSVEGGSLSEVEPMELGSEPGPSQELELCLPCFEEIGFEVLQKNSRITTTVPRSVQAQAMSYDQSPSPVSATSTNSSKVPVRPISPPRIQNNLSASLSDSSAEQVDATDGGHSSLLLQTLGFGGTGKTTKIDRESLKITIPPSNDFFKFSDDSPCCCSKKESASRAYQGAQFLNQSMMASGSIPLKGKHMNPTTNNNKREVSSSYATCSSSQIDGMLESPMTSMSLKSSLDASRRFPSSDFSLPSPTTSLIHPQSSSSPVLRLMGKNLTVVNKDEDESAQLPRAPVIAPSDHPNTKYLSLLEYSTCNLSRLENSSIHCESPEGSVIYNPDPANLSANFSAGFPNSFRCHSQSKVNQTPKTLQEMQMGGFAVPGSAHLSKGNSVSPNQQKRIDKKPNSSVEFVYNIERTVPHRQCPKPVAASQVASLTREVIIIDDSSGIEVDPRVNYWPSGSLDQLRFGGVFPPNTLNCGNSRKVKAFSHLPSQSPFSREPSSGLNPRYIMSCPRSNSTCTKQRGNSSEGSHVIPGSPFILSSAGYRNSNLLFSKPNIERK